MKHKNIIATFAATAVAVLALSGSTANAAPATFTVTNTNDSGPGSLRQAIIDANNNANAADMDVIEFDITGSSVQIISLDTTLPEVTEKITINGYSQPGASENTAASPNPFNNVIKIEVEGAEELQYVIKFANGSSGSIIKGLSIHSADQTNIMVDTQDIGVYGNYLSIKADGLSEGSFRSQRGVLSTENGQNMKVGGILPAQRNIINGYSAGSTALEASASVEIYGNYVGLGRDGITDLDSSLGVGTNNGGGIIGGTDAAKRNVISGCSVSCVVIPGGSGNIVQGNYIGTDYTGAVRPSISTGGGVILTANTTESLIGGTEAGEGNIIRGVSGIGVGILQVSIMEAGPLHVSPSKNAILGNTIADIGVFNYPGFGNSNQGIDAFINIDTSSPADFQPDEFGQQGPSFNDDDDSDTGPNGLINFPVLKTAQQSDDKVTVTYDLSASDSPSNTYRIEFFANNKRSIFGHGPGETYIGSVDITPGNNKTAVLTVDGDLSSKMLSATTTAIDATTVTGFGSTSEFAQNISIGSTSDRDADGISDAEEENGPNGGDANDDGVKDMLQPTVTTFVNSANIYITLATEGCSENGTVSSIDLSSLDRKDNGYTYPYGMTDFTLYCSRGDAVDVDLFVHTNISPDNYLARKFNPTENKFSDVLGATLVQTAIGDGTAMKLSYSLTDGGLHDDDGEANGVIVDPVGLATEHTSGTSSGELAKTGISAAITTFIAGSIIITVIYTYVDYRRHKRPLVEAAEVIGSLTAKSYTYWHHLRVVSIPLVRYRLRVVVEERRQTPETQTEISQ